jgi:hypothetical protein
VGSPPGRLGGRAVQATTITAVPDRRTLERLADDVVRGQLTVPVQRTYPLADVPRALADFAAGTRGKLPSAWPDRRVQSGGRYRNAGPAGTLAS